MARVEGSYLESLQVLLQQNPDSLTFAHVADVLLREGRLEEATRICEEGIRRHPYYVTGHMVLGKCYLQRSQFDQAEKEFKRVLLFDPKHLAAHKYFGDLMRQMGWDNTCESSYRKILQIDPLDQSAQGVLDELARGPVRPESASPPRAGGAFEPPTKTSEPTRVFEPPPSRTLMPSRTGGAVEPFRTSEPPMTREPVRALAPSRPGGASEPPIFPETPPAATPFDDDELLSPTGIEEGRLLNPPLPEIPQPSQRPVQQEPPRREMDEDQFSSILDDIFQDEVVDDRDRAERPPQFEAPKTEPDFDRDFGFADMTPSPPRRMPVEPPDLKPPRPVGTRPIDDFDDEVLGPPRPAQRYERPAFTTNLRDDEISPRRDAGDLDFMDIEGLEPEPTEEIPTERVPPFTKTQPPQSFPPPRSGRAIAAPLPGDSQGPLTGRERIVTPTLGEIYAAQGQFAKAIGVFELLLKKDPNNRVYHDKIDYLKKRLHETEHAG